MAIPVAGRGGMISGLRSGFVRCSSHRPMGAISRFSHAFTEGRPAPVAIVTWGARIAAGLGLGGAAAVVVAWSVWPRGEGLSFEILFSVGMLGVNAAWLLGVGVIVRVLLRTEMRRTCREALGWGCLAVALAEGVFF